MILEIKNLCAGYNDSVVINGVSLEIAPSQICAIIGPNGAGKSTLLKSIFSLCDVSSGSINFRGKDICCMKTHELIKLGINFVPQGKNVFENLTVLENLEMGDFVFRDQELTKKNLEEVFARFPVLKEKQNDLAVTLSGGQRQSLAIGKALMSQPEVLLLDEPSLGLDRKSIKQLFGKLKEIRDEGTAIILVEQNAKQAIEIADKTIVLENGQIALQGGREIVKNEMIKRIYLGGQ